ncbi:MAG: hypothetical protein EPN47_16715 [Acidobacteria bacterium]|nr:MAG: hypothetical protein EPN47_16715 [Acidobacteriota bacterium]
MDLWFQGLAREFYSSLPGGGHQHPFRPSGGIIFVAPPIRAAHAMPKPIAGGLSARINQCP